MNVKFEQPRKPNHIEQLFILTIEGQIKIDKEVLVNFMKCDERDLRFIQERYNNYKFIGYNPIGEIHCIKGNYTLVKPNTPLALKMQHKAYFNAIKALIAWRNSKRILGDIQAKGQLDFTKLEGMEYDEFQEIAKMMKGVR